MAFAPVARGTGGSNTNDCKVIEKSDNKEILVCDKPRADCVNLGKEGLVYYQLCKNEEYDYILPIYLGTMSFLFIICVWITILVMQER